MLHADMQDNHQGCAPQANYIASGWSDGLGWCTLLTFRASQNAQADSCAELIDLQCCWAVWHPDQRGCLDLSSFDAPYKAGDMLAAELVGWVLKMQLHFLNLHPR